MAEATRSTKPKLVRRWLLPGDMCNPLPQPCTLYPGRVPWSPASSLAALTLLALWRLLASVGTHPPLLPLAGRGNFPRPTSDPVKYKFLVFHVWLPSGNHCTPPQPLPPPHCRHVHAVLAFHRALALTGFSMGEATLPPGAPSFLTRHPAEPSCLALSTFSQP